MHSQPRRVSGHVFRKARTKGPVWYVKYRLPDGRQVQRALGPEWNGKGRPPDGYYTKRTAEAALQAILTDARRGTLAGMVKTGATFNDAAEDWLRHGEHERGLKPSTIRDYKSAVHKHLIPAFGTMRLEDVTGPAIEKWRSNGIASKELTLRPAIKLTTILHGIFERACRVYGLPRNPVDDVERLRERYAAENYDFYTPEDVWALARNADSEQDAAIYLVAAFAGLRMGEILALRVKDIDFDAEAIRVFGNLDEAAGIVRPKGGHGRSVPMVEPVAQALARLLQREHLTSPDDPLFPGPARGGYLDRSHLRKRYKAAQTNAELRPLRFHDLRHSFGSLAVNKANSIVELQHWLGHADARTTHRYTHYKQQSDAATRLAGAFVLDRAKDSNEEVAKRADA